MAVTIEPFERLTQEKPEHIFSCTGCNKDINLIKYSIDWHIGKPQNSNFISHSFAMGAKSEYIAKFVGLARCYNNEVCFSTVLKVSPLMPSFCNHKLACFCSHKLRFIAHLKWMTVYYNGIDDEVIKNVKVMVLDGKRETSNPGFSFNISPRRKYVIRCEILLMTGTCITSCTPRPTPKKGQLDPPSPALEIIATLFTDSLLADFTFAIGDVKISAHKCILAARSAVFKAMFLNDMQESQSNIVEITDASVEGFREFLRFIYTDQVTDLETHGEELLCLAEKYALQDLKDLCEESLLESLTVDNTAHLLILSNLQQATQLKLEAISFFLKHREAVRETEEWERARGEHSNIIAFLE